jgi:hypothetical protein
VLFFITYSLVYPLNLHAGVSSAHLHREVVHFTITSAARKVLNAGRSISKLKLDTLDLLSGIASADILSSKYHKLDELMKEGGVLRAIRLSWLWIEEVYGVQGVILRHNP